MGGIRKSADEIPGRMTIQTAARILRMSEPKLRDWMEKGKINIGYVTRRGRQRSFDVYAALVEKEKERLLGKGA